MNTSVTWVLVGNISYAKIFSVKGHGKEIKKVHFFDNPDGKKKPSEIVSDRPGRAFDRFGAGRHAVGTRVDVRGHQQEMFALKITEFLRKELDLNQFHDLVIVAPPQFLGEIQACLGDTLKKALSKEIAKDLPDYMDDKEIIEHLCKDLDLWNHAKAAG